MADNTPIKDASDVTVQIRSDELAGGVQVQVAKIALGLDGVEDTLLDSGQQTMANSLPVAIASNQTAIPVSDGGGVLTVDGAVTIGAAIPAGTNNIGDVDVLTLPALAAGNNNIGDVDIASIAAGDNNIGNVDVLTMPVGGYAAAADFISGTTAAITDTTRTEVIAAQGVGVKMYITSIMVTNSHASVGTFVKIESGTTTIFQAYADSVGGGFAMNFPIPLVVAANAALNVSCVTTGANVIANALGYKGA